MKIKTVFAHCDIPCGIYDPHEAQVAALTVLRMMDLIAESKDPYDIARYAVTKEQHAEKCKHEIRVIWGDYFKDVHLKQYPDLYNLNYRVMQLGSQAKQTKDKKVGKELLETINCIAEIFWETKSIKTKKIKSPYSIEEEIVVPDL